MNDELLNIILQMVSFNEIKRPSIIEICYVLI